MRILRAGVRKTLISPATGIRYTSETRRKRPYISQVPRMSRPSRCLPHHTIDAYRIPGKTPGEVYSYSLCEKDTCLQLHGSAVTDRPTLHLPGNGCQGFWSLWFSGLCLFLLMGIRDLPVEAVGKYPSELPGDLPPACHKAGDIFPIPYFLLYGWGQAVCHLLSREQPLPQPHAFQTDGIGSCSVDGDPHLPHIQKLPHLARIGRIDLEETEAPLISLVLQTGGHLTVGKNGRVAVAFRIPVTHAASGDDRIDILHDERFFPVLTKFSHFGHEASNLIRKLPGCLILRIEPQDLSGKIVPILVDVGQGYMVIV